MELISLHALLFVLAAAAAVALPLPLTARKVLLAVFNFGFLALFHPAAPLLFLGVSALGLIAARLAAAGAGRWLLVGLLIPLAVPLFLPKLAAFSGESADIGNVVGARLSIFIGASYVTLRTLHAVIDAARNRAVTLGPLDFLVWNSFFPTVVAGPIERADHLAQTLGRLGRPSGEDLAQGVTRIFIGLVKKLVLGSLALQWAGPIVNFGQGELPGTAQAWTGLYAIALYAWLDFAGYSDMAIGAARLLGLKLAENFDNPYLRPSIAEFWRGWHLSLSFWIRDYLFTPLCGRSKSRLRPHMAALLSMTLCGIWHAPTIGWTLWGLCHGAGLSVHQAWTTWLRRRFKLKQRLARSLVVRVVATLLTFHFVALTWTLVSIDSTRLGPALDYLALLFGAGPVSG